MQKKDARLQEKGWQNYAEINERYGWKMDYKNAGVDIEAGYRSVELMKKYVKETMRPEVLGGLGRLFRSFLHGELQKYGKAHPGFRNGRRGERS